LAEEQGVDLPTVPLIRKEDLPDLERGCATFEAPSAFPVMTKLAFKMPLEDLKTRKGFLGSGKGGRLPLGIHEHWVKWKSGEYGGTAELPFIADAVSLPAFAVFALVVLKSLSSLQLHSIMPISRILVKTGRYPSILR
jgi:hypothetical protein